MLDNYQVAMTQRWMREKFLHTQNNYGSVALEKTDSQSL